MGGEKGSDHQIINVWSGPRCVSTSLMYSFAQRKDTQVLDEPLYAHYLRLNPGLSRPYRDLVMESQNADGNTVVKDLILGPRERPVLYVKHMAKQRAGIDKNLLEKHGQHHVLLVRRPEAVIASFSEVLEPTLHETCYTALMELYSELCSMGKKPPIILSEDLVAAPESTLRALCSALDLPFDPEMLSWPEGPKPDIDGCWAPWWYKNTHKSTGFGTRKEDNDEDGSEQLEGEPLKNLETPVMGNVGAADGSNLEPHLHHLLEECIPLYEFLRSKALRPQELLNSETTATAALQPPPPPVSHGTHAHSIDPRNATILVGMRDGVTGAFTLVPRSEAKVSVLDSGFMLGDGIWEGLRVHRGVILFADEHFDRLYEGAKAIDMDIGLTPLQLQDLVYSTLEANSMQGPDATGIHIRLMVTRGLKPTPYQHPGITIGLPTIVVLPEWKKADPGPNTKGIRLFTVHVRRGNPDVQDPGWNSHSKLNCIAACIQAAKAGADEALMLDPRGFVATCNSTNFFIVRKGEVWAPGPGHQLRGITRAKVLDLCRENGIPVKECDFSLTQVYSADEAFVTGTFAGQIPVVEVDGRVIGDGKKGPMVERLQKLYKELCEKDAAMQLELRSGSS